MKTTTLLLIGLIAGGLLYLMVMYFPPSKTETVPAFTTTEKPTDFAEIGILSFATTTAQSLLFLNYQTPAGTTAVPLTLDEMSICSSSNGAIPCMAMSVTFDIAFGGKSAIVEGIQTEDGVLLRKLFVVEEGQIALERDPGDVFIAWSQAVSIIENCQAEMIMQTHALDVYLNLKDGKRVRAVEPVIDEVFRIYDESIAQCGNIPVATE